MVLLLLLLGGERLLAEQVEALGLDAVGERLARPLLDPGPARGTARPRVGALERRHHVDHIRFAYDELDLGAAVGGGRRVGALAVGHETHELATRALGARLRDERVKACAYLARAQVARGGDELDPERHGALAAVAELEQSAAGRRVVVDEVEDAHLVEEEHHLVLVGRHHADALVAAVVLVEQRDEARLLDLDLLEYVEDDARDLVYARRDAALALLHLVLVEVVQMVVEHARVGEHSLYLFLSLSIDRSRPNDCD